MKKLFSHFKYSFICSLAYCIPVFGLFENDQYPNVWLLYLGNFCFAFTLVACNIYLNGKEDDIHSLSSMLGPAFKMELTGILISCLLLLLLIIIFKASNIIQQSPGNILGLYYMLPLSVVLINLVVGSFCIFLWATIAQKDN